MFYIFKTILTLEKESFSKYLLDREQQIPMGFGTIVYDRIAKANRLKFRRRIERGEEPSLDLLLTMAHFDLVATAYDDEEELKYELTENIKLLLLAYAYINTIPAIKTLPKTTNNGENNETNLQKQTE